MPVVIFSIDMKLSVSLKTSINQLEVLEQFISYPFGGFLICRESCAINRDHDSWSHSTLTMAHQHTHGTGHFKDISPKSHTNTHRGALILICLTLFLVKRGVTEENCDPHNFSLLITVSE